MKHFQHIFLIATLCWLPCYISGCCGPIQRPMRTDVVMPLRVGNWWKARATSTSTWNPRRRDTSEEMRVVADTLIEGRRWFVMSDSSMLAYTLDGAQRRVQGVVLNDIEFRTPHHVGDTVYVLEYPSNNVRELGIVWVLDTLICVPAGQFRCFMVRPFIDEGTATQGFSRWYHDDATIFYARGVGRVKEESENGDIVSQWTYKWELVDYEAR